VIIGIIQRSIRHFVAEVRAMAAMSPGDVHGHFSQDPRKCGPYRVVAPWVAEEFPELATHADDPFHLYLKGEECFERSRKERILNRIGRYELGVFGVFVLISMFAFTWFSHPKVARETDLAVVFAVLYAIRFLFRGILRVWAGEEFRDFRARLPYSWMLRKMRAGETAMLPMSAREVALYRWGGRMRTAWGGNLLPLSIIVAPIVISCWWAKGMGPVLDGHPYRMCLLLAPVLIYFGCGFELSCAAAIETGARAQRVGVRPSITRWLVIVAGSLPAFAWYVFVLGVLGTIALFTEMEVRLIPMAAAGLLLIGTPPFVRGWSHRAARYYAARSMESYIAKEHAAVADADESRGQIVVRDPTRIG
jgi:hypothetical protein